MCTDFGDASICVTPSRTNTGGAEMWDWTEQCENVTEVLKVAMTNAYFSIYTEKAWVSNDDDWRANAALKKVSLSL